MCCDAVFSDAVHGLGADLQLYTLTFRPNHGCVYGAIVVLFWRRDVIFEAARYTWPSRMDYAQYTVAIFWCWHDCAKAVDIGELFEAERLFFHLAEDGVSALFASTDLGCDALFGEALRQVLFNVRDQAFVLAM